MSSVRTAEQLSDALADDLIWRKKELSAYKLALEGAKGSPDKRQAFLRGAVALLYAHWEGFVKTASSRYLEFVFYQRLKYSELAPHFLALAVRAMLRAGTESDRIAAHLRVTNFFRAELDKASILPHKDAFTTRGNLSSRVLKEIMETLGLDYSQFSMRAQLIDETLLDQRNTIAHGEYVRIDVTDYLALNHQVLEMIEAYNTLILNAAVLGHYRAAA
jgi:hypothetical protein